ncbi:hypothetical protein BH10PSE17_BH10PSE17_23760 [soil metagenome]
MDKDTDLIRRRWLELTSAGLVTLGFGGCGGGGSGDAEPAAAAPPAAGPAPVPAPPPASPPPPAPAPAGALTDAQRTAALKTIEASVNTALAGSLRFDATIVAAQLMAMPSIAKAGIHAPSQAVWARFVDGRRLVVPNHFASPASATSAARGSTRSKANTLSLPRRAHSKAAARVKPFGSTQLDALLTGRVFHQFASLGVTEPTPSPGYTGDTVMPDSMADLCRLASSSGFEVTSASLDQGKVANLPAADIGVMGIHAVSADFADPLDGEPYTVIATSTGVDVALTAEQYDKLDAVGGLTYMIAPPDLSARAIWRTVLGFTSGYLKSVCGFAPNSLLLLNLTGGLPSPDWVILPRLESAPVKTLLYWDTPLAMTRMLSAGIDIMRLMFATNEVGGWYARGVSNEPRFRNFGIGETVQYLEERGAFDDAQINLLRAPGSPVNTIRPAIDRMIVVETDHAVEIVGQFGANDDGRVYLVPTVTPPNAPQLMNSDPVPDGTGAVPILDWQGDVIKVDLSDRTGGYLQVVNGGRWSNVAQLTCWKPTFNYRQSIDDSLVMTAKVEWSMRQDVRGYRLRPDEAVGSNEGPFYANELIEPPSISWEASGRFVNIATFDDGTTERTLIDWTGKSDGMVDALPGTAFQCLLHPSTHHARTGLVAIAPGGFSQTVRITRTYPNGRTETIKDETTIVPVVIPIGPTDLSFEGAAFDLGAGNYSLADTVQFEGLTRPRSTIVFWEATRSMWPPERRVGGV